MGKRSDFERVPRDFYPTPAAAVIPLLPHLPPSFSYWEPCAGDGALIDALDELTEGGYCTFSSDIEPRWPGSRPADALDALDTYACDFAGADFVITNPPWDRKILHRMIEWFSDNRPTWLLFDADWIHTKQAIPYLPRLRKVVSVGRVKWVPGSKHTGKDNCAWHLFDKPSATPAEIFGRAL